jgi:hypothetical protein
MFPMSHSLGDWISRLLLALLILITAPIAGQRAFAQQTPADRLKANEAAYPPWQGGDGSDVSDRGLELTVPPADVLADFHGSLDNPRLVLFASGNFFALGLMVKAFGDAQEAKLVGSNERTRPKRALQPAVSSQFSPLIS